jgi:hypothetical protein
VFQLVLSVQIIQCHSLAWYRWNIALFKLHIELVLLGISLQKGVGALVVGLDIIYLIFLKQYNLCGNNVIFKYKVFL